MKKIITFVLAVFYGSLTGCAHSSHTRGSVALAHSSTEADVCLGSDEVSPGDKVLLYKNVCKNLEAHSKFETTKRSCEKKYLGTGIIKNIISEHYSLMTSSDVKLEEGIIVEK